MELVGHYRSYTSAQSLAIAETTEAPETTPVCVFSAVSTWGCGAIFSAMVGTVAQGC